MSPNRSQKHVYKSILETPFGKVEWPIVNAEDSSNILDILTAVISVGIKQGYIVVGFNEVNETAENSVKTGENSVKTAKSEEIPQDSPLAVIICRSDASSPLLTGHFPLLSAVSGLKLIQLPLGSAEKLASASKLNTIDTAFILLKKGLPGASALYDIISKIDSVNIPWINEHKTAIKSLKTRSGIPRKRSGIVRKDAKKIK